MEIVLLYFTFAGAVGYYAKTKGRSFFGWFLLSVVTSPIIGGVFALISTKKNNLPQSLESKLSEISRLKDKGLITPEEYETRRKNIIEGNV